MYKTFSKPTLTHGAPIWFPSMGPDHSSVKKLQRSMNNAMRVITGAHRDNPVTILLAETQLLSVKDSLELSCKQFLANAYTVGHPSHSVVKLETGQRKGRKGGIIHTLQSRFKESIVPYLNDDVM
jgi:hypothetical protein